MSKLLIWGTGQIAKELLENGVYGELLGFVETQKSGDFFAGKPVFSADNLPEHFDFIIIANSYAQEIYNVCGKMGIPIEKMIFLKAIRQQAGYADNQKIRSILGERNYTNYCSEYGLLEESFYREDMLLYNKLNKRKNFEIKEYDNWPVIRDKYAMAGTIGNYFWQDLWAAKLIIRSGVKTHFDIGSRLDGFIAHLLAADIRVNMIDIRPFPGAVENLYTVVDDATMLKNIEDGSLESLSALCSLEHFGLGRYGDPIDPEACFKCFEQIKRKMKPGGHLYISVPIGRERMEFNAHRVFYASTIVECFAGLDLLEFSCTADGKIEYDVELHKYDNDMHNGNYRYGLFHFVG